MTDERRKGTLSDDDFEAIAVRAAEIVEQRMYAAIGRGLVSKALYLLGAGIVAVAAWLGGAGKIKLP